MWILKWNLYSTSDKILSVKCILVDPWTTQFTIIHAFHILNKPRFVEYLKKFKIFIADIAELKKVTVRYYIRKV